MALPAIPGGSLIPDYLILNFMRDHFLACCNVVLTNFSEYAKRLLYLLAGIDLILAVLFNLEDADHMKTLIIKTIKYGFFIYLVANYKEILNVFIQGFQFFGRVAGKNLPGSDPISDIIITDPAAIGTYGIYLIRNVLPELTKYGASGGVDTQALLTNGVLFLIASSYALIGIQMFVLIVEFYLVGALSMILIPFGVNKYTSFLTQGVLRALFTIGVKLMVMMFIIAMVVPILIKLDLIRYAKLDTCMYTLIASIAIAYLTLHAPNLAMSMMSGTPSMSASGFMGAATTAGRAPGMIKDVFGKKEIGKNLNKGESDMRNLSSSALYSTPPSSINPSNTAEAPHSKITADGVGRRTEGIA